MPQSRDEHYRYSFRGIKLDPYRILQVYGITDPAIQHAIKKLLRGGKSIKSLKQDIEEVVMTLQRKLEMLEEDAVEEAKAVTALGAPNKIRKALGYPPFPGGLIVTPTERFYGDTTLHDLRFKASDFVPKDGPFVLNQDCIIPRHKSWSDYDVRDGGATNRLMPVEDKNEKELQKEGTDCIGKRCTACSEVASCLPQQGPQ